MSDEGHDIQHGCRGQPEAEHGVLRFIAEELVSPEDGVERRAKVEADLVIPGQ